jgi:uncharacterized membrane protein
VTGTNVCPACDTERAGAFRYCRQCGFDFDTATLVASPGPATVGGYDREVAVTALASVAIALLALANAPLALRVAPGVVGVFLLPGYALSLAVLPGHLERFDRLALAFALSLAVTVVLALVLNAVTGITQPALVLGLTVSTLLSCAVAWLRRRRNPPAMGRSDVVVRRTTPPAPEVATVAVLIAVGLVLFGGLVTMLIATPTPTTEFYMLGPSGLAEGYPRDLPPGRPATVTLGIANREGVPARYRVAVDTANRTVAEMGPIDLGSGQDWQGNVAFALPGRESDVDVQILLFKDGGAQAYRTLRLWVDETPSG